MSRDSTPRGMDGGDTIGDQPRRRAPASRFDRNWVLFAASSGWVLGFIAVFG